jgi:flagellar P-ring protein precursor FlgI
MHLLAVLLLALQQDKVAPLPPSPPVPAPLPVIETGVWTEGAQAPEQPQSQSSSGYTRGPRNEPALARTAATSPIRATVGSLVQVRGQEANGLVGVGLVTGLAGTGDSINMTRGLVQNLLFTHNIKIDAQQITARNVALVHVEAELPPGVQPGQRIDVRVSTMGDAKSLQNGTLTLTELTDITGAIVYATAAGPLNTGGFAAEGDSASVTQNAVTVGVLSLGGKVERAVPSRIVDDNGYIYLDSRAAHGSYGNVVRITDAINEVYPGVAFAVPDGRTVRVQVPVDLPEASWMSFLDTILRREIEPDDFPRVLVNERTGAIVIGDGVRLRPMAISFGDLTVTVAESPSVSQPGPFSNGLTREIPRTDLGVSEDNNGVVLMPGAGTLQEVVEVLNVLGTTPRDTISALEAMAQAGMLLAEIQRM